MILRAQWVIFRSQEMSFRTQKMTFRRLGVIPGGPGRDLLLDFSLFGVRIGFSQVLKGYAAESERRSEERAGGWRPGRMFSSQEFGQ